jgi:hypothetical protein
MKNILIKSAIFLTCIILGVDRASQSAIAGGIGNNYIGPSVSFGGGSTAFGINSKFGIADNVALRPFVIFPAGGTIFGSSITYDWDLRKSAVPITPFIGLGLAVGTGGGTSTTTGFAQVGADFDVSDSFALVGSVAIPFRSNNTNTSINLGAGLRF